MIFKNAYSRDRIRLMLDIKFIRENAELLKEATKKKHLSFDVDELIKQDSQRLEILKSVEELRAEQNRASDEITKGNAGERTVLIESMKVVKESLKKKSEASL